MVKGALAIALYGAAIGIASPAAAATIVGADGSAATVAVQQQLDDAIDQAIGNVKDRSDAFAAKRASLEDALAGRSTAAGMLPHFVPNGVLVQTYTTLANDQYVTLGLYSNGDVRAREATISEIQLFSDKAAARLPEPASWALLITGIGAIGWLVRRGIRASELRLKKRLDHIVAGEIA